MIFRTLALALPVALAATTASATTSDYLYLFGFDTSATAYSGTGSGTATNTGTTIVTDATRGSVASFDGSSYVTVNENVSEGAMATMSWGGWFNASAGTRYHGVLSADNGGFDRLMGIDTRGNPGRDPAWAAFNGSGVQDITSMTLDTWVHLVATYDGSKVQLFANGVLASEVTESWTAGTSMLSYFTIGANAVHNEYFTGLADDVFLFDRTLGESEVKSIYDNGFTTPAVPLPAGLPLLIAGLGGLAALRRRKG
ncbi:LamG-like jellyroll fold domain-containing protein [Pseudooceanicola onchidii]|uniref:LamG-like jellyroll fold domain-containing protein n=1 Tax=Pseudooceanicola onchidii TaxID=2562279 RepID=UPI00145AF1BA|nr:LamG-like jellyroll fold domain-containing protein [Pseudooceanicola onchidii]